MASSSPSLISTTTNTNEEEECDDDDCSSSIRSMGLWRQDNRVTVSQSMGWDVVEVAVVDVAEVEVAKLHGGQGAPRSGHVRTEGVVDRGVQPCAEDENGDKIVAVVGEDDAEELMLPNCRGRDITPGLPSPRMTRDECEQADEGCRCVNYGEDNENNEAAAQRATQLQLQVDVEVCRRWALDQVIRPTAQYNTRVRDDAQTVVDDNIVEEDQSSVDDDG
uniref:Uncharacterized protein n=1 Tax=Oryza punctata TaxID=4537 RepID=A0A0E0LRQ3_ORYPU